MRPRRHPHERLLGLKAVYLDNERGEIVFEDDAGQRIRMRLRSYSQSTTYGVFDIRLHSIEMCLEGIIERTHEDVEVTAIIEAEAPKETAMAKHNPAGEVCPHCPPGTSVGWCVRHMLGWDPEPGNAIEKLVGHVDLSNFESFHKWALTIPAEQAQKQKFHVRVCGGQFTDEAVCTGYGSDSIAFKFPSDALGGPVETSLAWGDVVELWPLP